MRYSGDAANAAPEQRIQCGAHPQTPHHTRRRPTHRISALAEIKRAFQLPFLLLIEACRYLVVAQLSSKRPYRCFPVVCTSDAYSCCLLSSIIQFVSQVLPPSSENACSQWHEVVVMPDQRNRLKMCSPSKISCA